ncbi:MAG: nitrile hydratase accessory protein [Chloroflexota bacterium]
MAEAIDQQIASMDDSIALPRKNGELIFEAPWEARAFGLAVALNEQGTYPWRDFSEALAREISEAELSTGSPDESSTYYKRWLATLEEVVLAAGLVTHAELDAEVTKQAKHDAHTHNHSHDHEYHHHHDI